jgi:hypothetical protein
VPGEDHWQVSASVSFDNARDVTDYLCCGRDECVGIALEEIPLHVDDEQSGPLRGESVYAAPMVAQVGLNDPLPFLRFLLSDIGSHLTPASRGSFPGFGGWKRQKQCLYQRRK